MKKVKNTYHKDEVHIVTENVIYVLKEGKIQCYSKISSVNNDEGKLRKVV